MRLQYNKIHQLAVSCTSSKTQLAIHDVPQIRNNLVYINADKFLQRGYTFTKGQHRFFQERLTD